MRQESKHGVNYKTAVIGKKEKDKGFVQTFPVNVNTISTCYINGLHFYSNVTHSHTCKAMS